MGKATAKILRVNVNVQLLLVFSVIPDVDLLIPGLRHRGATHSLLIYVLLLILVFIVYGRRTLPYFVSLAQHSLIGDCFAGKVQLLWPLSNSWYGMGIQLGSMMNITAEWILFIISAVILVRTDDAYCLLQGRPFNLTHFIPAFTIISPILFSFPISIPSELMIPHLVFLVLFQFSILTGLLAILRHFGGSSKI